MSGPEPLIGAPELSEYLDGAIKTSCDWQYTGPLPAARRDLTRGVVVLLNSGLEDHTVPDVVTRSTLEQCRDSTAVTDLTQFEGRGHSLTVDDGYKEVADATLDWLKANGL